MPIALETAYTDAERLAALAVHSADLDAVLVEVVYHGKWVRFDMSVMELQHAPVGRAAEKFAQALADVGAPKAVTAD